ncbi:MAG: CHAT domain-containing protein [Acidobacteriota bacterium]
MASASQDRADVVWQLSTPRGTVEIDLPGRDGPEVLCWRASAVGTYDLELVRGQAGRSAAVDVEIKVLTVDSLANQASEQIEACVEAVSAWLEAEKSVGTLRARALERTTRAADRADLPVLASIAHVERALLALEDGFPEEARVQVEEATATAARGEPVLKARVLARAAQMLLSAETGKVFPREQVEAWLGEVLEQAEIAGDDLAIARGAHSLGVLAQEKGRFQAAAEQYAQARQRWPAPDRLDWAVSTSRLAAMEVMQSRLDEAREMLEEVLTEVEFGPGRHRCEALLQLGWVHIIAENAESAVPLYEQGLAQCADDISYRIAFNDRMATAQRRLGNLEVAEALYLEAYGLTDKSQWLAHIATSLSRLYVETGQLEEAWVRGQEGVDRFRGVDSNGLAHALAWRGRIEAMDGRLDEAVASLEEATRVADAWWLDSYRAGTLPRSTSLVQDIDRVYVEHAMALAGQTGDPALVDRVFRRSDYSRARNLVAVLGTGAPPPSPADLESIVDSWPPGVALLSYVFGETTSYAFVLRSDGISWFELADRKSLEIDARRWLAAIQASPLQANTLQREALGRRLAEILLAPLWSHVESSERWVVVADGVLGHLPFAALPDPSGNPLVERFELVHGPSISALARLPKRSAEPSSNPASLIALADPVYSRWDERCQECAATGETQSGDPSLLRLEGAGEEAELLARIAPSGQFYRGFAASRRTVMDGALAEARIVHFAVHSAIDPRYPERSGIQLSRFDSAGSPIDGLLTLEEIQDLELSADLVVLSACRTVWDEGVRGDGLVGFAQAFQIAGAHSVIVSLWDIDDRATAEFMAKFYRRLVERGESPASAMRATQAEVSSDPESSSPSIWAGWQVIEDWRS